MTKIFLVLFVLLVFSSLNTGKAEKSEEKTDNTGNTKEDEDESASIQVVQRDAVTDTVDKPLINEYNPHEEENYTEVLKDTNITKAEAKYDKFFEGLNSDSFSGDILLENRDDNIEEVSKPGVISIENLENNEYSNRQEKIDIVFEDVTKAYNHDENSQEESRIVDEDENDWRSAENFHSGSKKDEENEESSVEENDRDYIDKMIGLEGRMELKTSERREHFNTWPINARQYGPPEDHGILDPGPMRSFSEIIVPRYRPVLTRAGIVYSPTLLSTQTGSSLLERLSGRNWIPNRAHMNPETEAYSKPRLNIIGVPQYEDSKMIDDYNDYGSNTNTYSYAPVKKVVTTQAPPQQIVAPNKFDVFQKLVEASNHPKSQKKTLNEFYHPHRRQYSESYGSYGVRRVRQNS